MAKRKQRGNAAKPAAKPPEGGLGLVRERHTGEGSASALATLQRMELERGRREAEPGDGSPSDSKR